ncbi:MAG: helix-turn-helix domain-containing protein [Geminicoccaceae bacterium]
MDSEADLLTLIGTRVADRRAALGLTLDEVAARADVSRAMVSRIERGEVHASAVVLDRLCSGLGLTLSALFARDAAPPLLRRADQPVWRDPATGYLRREVAPSGTGSPVRIVEVEFPPGAEIAFEPTRHRVVDQHVWVLDGTIEATLGDTTWRLAKGDCLHMRLGPGNAFRNPGPKPARYAVILTSEPVP